LEEARLVADVCVRVSIDFSGDFTSGAIVSQDSIRSYWAAAIVFWLFPSIFNNDYHSIKFDQISTKTPI